MKSTELRPGMAIVIDGQIFLITQRTHVTPGNLRAFVQIKARNVKQGSYIERRLRSGEEVEQAILDRRELEYLYSDNTGAVFMDTSSYDQITMDPDVLGEALDYLIPNAKVVGLVHEENVISIELPKTVDLKVIEAEPGVKGATVTNVMKDAKVETGKAVKVPQFIGVGESIRISTETGEYLNRV